MEKLKRGFIVISNILLCALILSLLARLLILEELSTIYDVLLILLLISRLIVIVASLLIIIKPSSIKSCLANVREYTTRGADRLGKRDK